MFYKYFSYVHTAIIEKLLPLELGRAPIERRMMRPHCLSVRWHLTRPLSHKVRFILH